ncbi:uncharacterized protein LOC111607573 isoform X2 [Xiphophorus maculatus]|uniref:uncharacterized protein LOC111607573 isoform X2 n=1 Tax=Xiphophorus maculatus TaxID=8083 RepID=UPI000C6DFE2B|nr:uncharacterized protein LOC111607573 isoform X2 [Xiphophorus maculatus]
MDLLGTVLLLVLVGSEAQNLKNVTVEPGQDVTLTCSFNSSDIFWFMKIHSQFRIQIGHIRSSLLPVYSSLDFKSKFSMSGNQLVIKTVSAEDSRLYYCGMKQSDQMVYKDTFSLSVFPVTRPTSPSVRLNISSSPSCSCESERLTFIIYRSAAILGFLLSLTGQRSFPSSAEKTVEKSQKGKSEFTSAGLDIETSR